MTRRSGREYKKIMSDTKGGATAAGESAGGEAAHGEQ